MAKSTAVEVFEHYYQAMVWSLPMRHDSFVKELQKHDLLPTHVKAMLESLRTLKEKASYFLDNVIKPNLDTYTCFDELLSIMMDSSCGGMKDLATEVRSKLPTNNKEDSKGIIAVMYNTLVD